MRIFYKILFLMSLCFSSKSSFASDGFDSFINALNDYLKTNFKVSDYHQHSRGSGSDAAAIAYIEIQNNKISDWGAGIDQNTTVASYKAILNCINKILS